MELPTVEQQTAIVGLITAIGTMLGTILAFFLAREKRLTRIETKLDLLVDDVDKIALRYLKTPKALALEKERLEKERLKKLQTNKG